MPSHELGGRGSEDKLLQAPQEAKYLLIVAFIVWLLLSRNVSHESILGDYHTMEGNPSFYVNIVKIMALTNNGKAEKATRQPISQ